MTVRIDRRRIAHVLFGVVVLIATMLLGTATYLDAAYDQREPWPHWPVVPRTLSQLQLQTENSVGAWFSSMLLLLVSVGCVVCFCADQWDLGIQQRLRFGWLLLALIFAALSLDEIGTFHERVPFPHDPWDWVIWLGPFVVAGPLYMLLFGWLHVRRSLGAAILLAAGVACLATIPLQEHIEITIYEAQGYEWQRPIGQVLLEEGTELAAMALFLAATLVYARQTRRRAQGASAFEAIPISVSRSLAGWSAPILPASLAVSLIATEAIIGPPDVYDGVHSNWFPSALALFAALLCVQLYDEARLRAQPGAHLLLATAAICLLCSAYIGAGLYRFDGLTGTSWPKLAAILLIALICAGLAWRSSDAWFRLGLLGWVILSVPGLIGTGRFTIAAAWLTAFACLSVALVHLLPRSPVTFSGSAGSAGVSGGA